MNDQRSRLSLDDHPASMPAEKNRSSISKSWMSVSHLRLQAAAPRRPEPGEVG
jgi:hypothetical protein